MPRNRFRWRVIPVAILALYGLSFFAGEVVAAVFILRWVVEGIQDPTLWLSPPSRFFQYLVLGHIGGGILVLAACLWWKGHWWIALALVATFFTAGEVSARLGLIPP